MVKRLPFVAIAISFVLALSVGVAAPVYAQEETASSEQQRLLEEYKNKAKERAEEAKKKAKERAEEVKAQAMERAKEANEQAQQTRLEAKQQVCEKKQETFAKHIDNKQEVATKILEKFDSFQDKVDRFIENKELAVEDYVTVKGDVEVARAAAAEAALALEELGVEVDCENVEETKALITGYRDQVKDARDALKDYRQALVDYVVAVKTSFNNSQAADAEESVEESESDSDVEVENNVDEQPEEGSDV